MENTSLTMENVAWLRGEYAMTIAEVSRKYGITADTLRYYERIGLIPPVPRNGRGIRDYDEKACAWVEFIKCMRGAGLQIDALTEYVSLFPQGEASAAARKQILVEQRQQLAGRIAAMQAVLDRLDYKISIYGETGFAGEAELR